MAKASSAPNVPSIAAEFANAELGDARRTRRLESLAELIGERPDLTIAELTRDDAELEAAYRFLANEGFGLPEMLEPHYEATKERSHGQQTVLAIADISDFMFPLGGHLREGCGVFGRKQGFRAAVTLALAGDGSNRPLGLLNCDTWVCEPKKRVRAKGKKKSPNTWGRTEGARWASWARASETRMGDGPRVIHVSDREASTYEFFANAMQRSGGFVVRLLKSRSVALEEEPAELLNVHEVAQELPGLHQRAVPLSKRKGQYLAQVNPERDARLARLVFKAVAIRLRRPRSAPRELAEELTLNLVCVVEPNPPQGEEPVEWLIATTESIETPADVARVVDIYRARWTIEEFFKAVKTGCNFESRRHESYTSLTKLLAIVLVIAWRILLLRHVARTAPRAKARTVLSPLQFLVLRSDTKVRLKKDASVRDALLGIARLGGHLKRNGEPGWLVLFRGMEDLAQKVTGCASMLTLLAGP